jgi:hypothetical protein
MVPLTCRLLISVASLWVPRPKRTEWKREWAAELWHRAEAGADAQELLRRASGVFRDAAWFRENERKQNGTDLFGAPLRMETIFMAACVLVALFSGAFLAPRLPYADAERLVSFERDVAFMGALDTFMSPKLPGVLKKSPLFTGVGLYRVLRDPVLGLRVSRNFFDVLGAKPVLGRTFIDTDGSDVVVLPYDVWRGRLHGDPAVIGKIAMIDQKPHTIVGVMPRDFWFRTTRFQYFAPFSWRTTSAGAIGRLKPGVTLETAIPEVRKEALTVEPLWYSKVLRLQPMLVDYRMGDLLFALEVALLAAALGMGFLILKGLGRRPRYWLMLGARIVLVVFGLAMLRLSLSRPRASAALSWEIFAFWTFLLLCCAAVCLLVTDHRARCLVCLSKLRKPVPIGSWSSQILDQPATEYLCPEGHGTLYVAETGNAPDYWTVLDDSWRDLFTHTKP